VNKDVTKYRCNPVGVLFFSALMVILPGCSSAPPAGLGIGPDGALASCPDSPNCVSSFASQKDRTHYIAPLSVNKKGWEVLQQIVDAEPRFKIVKKTGTYLHVEATTRLLHFVDDLEFLYQPARLMIQVRSASRVGYSDFGKNRSRVEALRKELGARGVLR